MTNYLRYIILGILLATAPLVVGLSAAARHNTISFGDKDYLLDGNTILLDSEGLYDNPDAVTDPLEAFRKINMAGKSATLLVAPSVYWLDDPDDPEVRTDKGGTPYAFKIECDTLRIIGLGTNPEDVVFAVNRGQTQGAIGNFTMFHFKGHSLETSNITFGNYCNTDLVYPRNPDLNRPRRKDAIVQAQIGICENTDRLFADNCHFISRLNLCPFVGARRSLYYNCYFECTDDALSGSAIYLDCRFTFFSSKPFYSTAETGAVFLNCDIHTLCSGPQYFTKIPGTVTAIDTRFTSEHQASLHWTRDASDVTSYQSNISLNGEPYIIDAGRRMLGPDLSAPLKDAFVVEAGGKTIYNLPNLLGSIDGWDPLLYAADIKKAEETLGRKLTGLPVGLRLSADKTTLSPRGDKATLTATPLLWGGYEAEPGQSFTFVSDNRKPELLDTTITYSERGLTARKTLKIEPNFRRAPEFKKKPSIHFDASSGQYIADYELRGKGADRSTIMWGRMEDAEGEKKAILLRHAEAPGETAYTPVAADLGTYIFAVVIPRFSDSHQGEMQTSAPVYVSSLDNLLLPEATLSTDFSDIPVVRRSPGIVGAWTFDIFKPADTEAAEWAAGSGPGWRYGKGYDASVSEGLVQTEKGARISYIPLRDFTQEMKATLTVEPAKSGGQGFGSATSQYMDICVKFDPVSLCGYALRIERVPEHDRAVQFSLVEYDNGATRVINPGVVSDCFRTPCTISVEVSDGTLRARALTEALPAKPCCGEVVTSVDISAPVKESGLGGFAVQHTGSAGASSTLIRNLELEWK
ncbi:MAG: hypothetical protein K2K93_09005 [Muribaculaceae bacterium]|nr:hypothetical protein [Muribaculaceae bacterium]